jgi:hypothetical protein
MAHAIWAAEFIGRFRLYTARWVLRQRVSSAEVRCGCAARRELLAVSQARALWCLSRDMNAGYFEYETGDRGAYA